MPSFDNPIKEPTLKVLGLDTATVGCSVALVEGRRVVAERSVETPRGQSESLVPMICDVLSEASVDWKDLDLIAVTVGPGAFTGLRIGLSAARGAALAAKIPCLGVTTLEAIAQSALSPGPFLAVLDTKRADFYAQSFGKSRQPLGEPLAVMPDALPLMAAGDPVFVVGDAAEQAIEILAGAGVRAVWDGGPSAPNAGVVAALAADRWVPGSRVPPPTPLYLRPADAVKPRNGGRLRP